MIKSLFELAAEFVGENGFLYPDAAFACQPRPVLEKILTKLSAADLNRLDSIFCCNGLDVDNVWKKHCQTLHLLRRSVRDEFGETNETDSYTAVYHHKQFHSLITVLSLGHFAALCDSPTPTDLYTIPLHQLKQCQKTTRPEERDENCNQDFLMQSARYCKKLVLNGRHVHFITSNEDLMSELVKHVENIVISPLTRFCYYNLKNFLQRLLTVGRLKHITLRGSTLYDEDLVQLMTICSGCSCFTGDDIVLSSELDVEREMSKTRIMSSFGENPGQCDSSPSQQNKHLISALNSNDCSTAENDNFNQFCEFYLQDEEMDWTLGEGASNDAGVTQSNSQEQAVCDSFSSDCDSLCLSSPESSTALASPQYGYPPQTQVSIQQSKVSPKPSQVSCIATPANSQHPQVPIEEPQDSMQQVPANFQQSDRSIQNAPILLQQLQVHPLEGKGFSHEAEVQDAQASSSGRNGVQTLAVGSSKQCQSGTVSHSLSPEEIYHSSLSLVSRFVSSKSMSEGLSTSALLSEPAQYSRNLPNRARSCERFCTGSGGVHSFAMTGETGTIRAGDIIGHFLPHWSNLKKLSVFLSSGIRKNVKELLKHKQLSHLIVDTCLRDDFLEDLVHLFSAYYHYLEGHSGSPMELLQISSCNLTCSNTPRTINPRLCAVRLLDLSWNTLSTETFALLLEFVKADRALKGLILASCQLQPDKICQLLTVLRERDTDTENLCLSDNRIEEEGCEQALTQFVLHAKSLQKLSLSNVTLASTVDSCPEFVSAVGEHPSLKVLDVSNNYLGAAHLKLIESILCHSVVMKTLNFAFNQFSGQDLIEMSKRVTDHPAARQEKLDVLCMSRNIFNLEEHKEIIRRFLAFAHEVKANCASTMEAPQEHAAQM